MASPLDAAASVASATLAYAVSAADNRRLVVGITSEGTQVGNHTCDYGGQTGVFITSSIAGSGTTQQTVSMFAFTDAQIAAASGTTITAGNVPADYSVNARSYQDCGQGTITNTDTDNSAASTPNPLAACDITTGAADAVVVSTSGMGNAGSAAWANLTEQTDQATASANGSLADSSEATPTTVACECTWTTQNRAAIVAIELVHLSAAGITDVSPDPLAMDTNFTITGADFAASGNTVYWSDVATLAGGPNEVDISARINTESTTSITMTMSVIAGALLDDMHTLGPGARYVIVDTGTAEYSYQVTNLFRPKGLKVVTSGGMFTSGVTTSQLTGLTGTFGGGRIEQDPAQNPSTTLTNVADDGNREDELTVWEVAHTRDVEYVFRAVINGVPCDTITVTPSLTFSAGNFITLTATTTANVSFLKQVGLPKLVAVPISVSMIKSLLRNMTVAVPVATVLTAIKTTLQSMVVAVPTAVSLTKNMFKSLNVAVPVNATLTTLKSFLRTLTVAVPITPVLTSLKAIFKSMVVAVPTVASMSRNISKILSVAVPVAATINRIRALRRVLIAGEETSHYGPDAFNSASHQSLSLYDSDWVDTFIDGSPLSVRSDTDDVRSTASNGVKEQSYWDGSTLTDYTIKGDITIVAGAANTRRAGFRARGTPSVLDDGYSCEWSTPENKIQLWRVTTGNVYTLLAETEVGTVLSGNTYTGAYLRVWGTNPVEIRAGDDRFGDHALSYSDTHADRHTSGQPGLTVSNVTQVLVAAVDNVEIFTFEPGVPIVATLNALKVFLRSMVVAVPTSASMIKSLLRNMIVAVPTNATLVTLKSFLRSLVVAVPTNVSMIKSLSRTLIAAVPTSVSMIKSLPRTLIAAVSTNATLTILKSFLRSLTVAVPTSASMIKSLSRTLIVAVPTSASMIKSLLRNMIVAVPVNATLVKIRSLTQSLVVAVPITATLSLVKSVFRALIVAVPVNASMIKSLLRNMIAAVPVNASMIKSLPRTLIIAVSTVASIVKQIGIPKIVSVPINAVLVSFKSFTRSLIVAVPTSISMIKSLPRTLTIAVPTSVSLIKSLLRNMTVAVPVNATLTTLKSLLRSLVVAVPVNAVLAKSKTFLRTLIAAVPINISMIKSLPRTLNVAVPVNATLTTLKSFLRTLTVAVPVTVNLVKDIAKSMVAVVTVNATLTKLKAALISLVVAVPVNVSMIKSLPRTLIAAVPVNATIIRSIRLIMIASAGISVTIGKVASGGNKIILAVSVGTTASLNKLRTLTRTLFVQVPTFAVLVTSAVIGGTIHVFRLAAQPVEWVLRRLRRESAWTTGRARKKTEWKIPR